ncbi:hypothetical protein F4810DRAFT_723467 [Camillea tinctor]|nr:hypothetical protein F4810DRAFT_723467 [Camillea tinctor]
MAEEQDNRMILDGKPAPSSTNTMMSWVNLNSVPTEIMEIILEPFKIEPLQTRPWNRLRRDYAEKKTVLINMSLVSKGTHDIANKFLYWNVFIYSGSQAALLLRTLWNQPNLRTYTRHVTILRPMGGNELADVLVRTWEEKCNNQLLAQRAVGCDKVMKDVDGCPQLNLAFKGPELLHLQREFDHANRLSFSDPRPLKFISAIFALLENLDDVLLHVPDYRSKNEGYQIPTQMGLFDPILHPLLPALKTLRMQVGRCINIWQEPAVNPLYLQFMNIGRGTNPEKPTIGTVTRFECHSDNGDWSPLFGEIRNRKKILGELPALKQEEIDKFSVLEDLRLYNSKTTSNSIYIFLMRCANLWNLAWVTSDDMEPEDMDHPLENSMSLEDALNPGAERLRSLHLEPRGTNGATLRNAPSVSFAHFTVLTHLAVDINTLLGYCHVFWRHYRDSDSEEENLEDTDTEDELEIPALASLLPISLVDLTAIDYATYLGEGPKHDPPSEGGYPPTPLHEYIMWQKLWEFVADCPTTHPNLRYITLRTFREDDFSADSFHDLAEAFEGIGVSFSWEAIVVEPLVVRDAVWDGAPEDVWRPTPALQPWVEWMTERYAEEDDEDDDEDEDEDNGDNDDDEDEDGDEDE